jgi:hypothetical protein
LFFEKFHQPHLEGISIMKIAHYLLIISLAAFSSGCKKDTVELPDALVNSKTLLTAKFTALNEKMAAASTYMGTVNMDATLIRAKLQELVSQFPYVVEFAQISSAGIMQAIEPAVYQKFEGSNISTQDHVIKAFGTKAPVLSMQFLAVEGYFASVVMHPIIKNGSVAGGITTLFKPETVLESIFKPLNDGQGFELWAIEKGGRLLFDPVASEIGNNLLTDPMYKDFPDLIAAIKKIDAEDSGTTTYSYFTPGNTVAVKKLTYWTTFDLYGTQWKLIWSKPE